VSGITAGSRQQKERMDHSRHVFMGISSRQKEGARLHYKEAYHGPVIDSGPDAYIRHPGYVGFVAFLLATPLLLASA
jgi:protein-S-isoprenylcysteine O-methyltransferase Ste14